MKSENGTIYLLHFDQRMAGRQHYLGWTANLQRRIGYHRAGQGGRTTARFHAAKIGFQLVATWTGTREEEKRMKGGRLSSLCPVCKEEKVTVLEAMQKMAGAARRVVASLRDLTQATGSTSYQVRQEIVTLLEEKKIRILSKGDAARNKTEYEIAQFWAPESAVRKNSAQHSASQENHIAEQDAKGRIDCTELSTVRSHSGIVSAVDGSAQSLGDTTQVVPPRTQDILHKVAMPPVLAHFGNLPGLGRCLDQTAHYIVDFDLLNLGLRNPEWLPKSLHQGTIRVFHVRYTDSRVDDVFHALLFFFGDDADANACTRVGRTACRGHLLMRRVRAAFPSAELVYDRPCTVGRSPEVLYDVRPFCHRCAGLPVPAGVMPGIEYVRAELPSTSNAGLTLGAEGAQAELPPGGNQVELSAPSVPVIGSESSNSGRLLESADAPSSVPHGASVPSSEAERAVLPGFLDGTSLPASTGSSEEGQDDFGVL